MNTIQYNEFDTPSPDEQATREARWNIERSQMRLLTEGTPDGQLYSLEASLAHHVPDVVWTMDQDIEDLFKPVDPDAYPQPELTPVVGTYAHVSAVATRLNADQRKMGVVTYIYAPALIEPQKVAS